MSRLPLSSLTARVAATATLALAAVAVAAPSASAGGCQPDAGNHQATAFASDTDTELRLVADGANLEANNVSCGALTNIDTVTVDMSAKSNGRVVFDLSGGLLGPGFTDELNGSSEIEFTVVGMSSIGQIHVLGSTGDDAITFGFDGVGQINLDAASDGVNNDVDVEFATLPSVLFADGKAGNDGISAAGVVDLVSPYPQSVTFTGGPGSNNLMGGSANDELRIHTESVSTGHDIVYGGGGTFDRVVITTDSPDLVSSFSLDDVANDGVGCPGPDCEGDNIGSDITAVLGSSASETLIGRDGQSDVLGGGGGNDVVMGLDGFDTLYCDGGKVFGGPGGDFVNVAAACTVVTGGPGKDYAQFSGAEQAVTVTLDGVANDGVAGADTNVRNDVENVIGSRFGDTLVGNDKRNVLDGGSGRDLLIGGLGGDRLDGRAGSDDLQGDAGDDRLFGGAGDDSLDGGDDVDLCKQGPGAGVPLNCE